MMIAGKISDLMANVKASVRSFIPIIILIVFTLIGGVIFMSIEGPHEKYELEKLKHERERLLEDTAFRLNTIKHMTPIEAYNHTVETLTNYRNELGVHEIHLNETKWTIWGSIYYSMTVYTTIGYGNITPKTTTGRILTIIYAFIGIPLALISLIALGSLFAKGCLTLWKFIVRACGCFSKNLERKMTRLGPSYNNTNKNDDESEESSDDSEELLHFPVTFLIFLTICWIFLCAYIFLLWEETWTYGTSLYFVLISFTTIGFGDVLVSKSKYIIPVGCLLLIGLALVSTVLTIIQKQIEAVATNMRDNIDKEYMAALEQADQEDDETEDAMENGTKKGSKDGEAKERKQKSLDEVIKRMPLKSRFLYHIMPTGNRKQIAKHAKQRARVGFAYVQTDPWLMEGASNALDNINY
ncbi:Ion channel [Aphelenchoides bicaudatus]|nr:Ion channel [Aphelenchoides bicaudatus]